MNSFKVQSARVEGEIVGKYPIFRFLKKFMETFPKNKRISVFFGPPSSKKTL